MLGIGTSRGIDTGERRSHFGPAPTWRRSGAPLGWATVSDHPQIVCISSIAQLEKLSGKIGIKDLHRESIDGIVIPSHKGKGDLRRIEEVFDCWFESGR